MTDDAKWVTLTPHRLWLTQQAESLLGFFERRLIDPRGGFHDADTDGAPLPSGPQRPRYLHATSRMVYCFALARLMGRPGADAVIDHGMDYLWRGHRDAAHGGYVWAAGEGAPLDDTKQAYGHAFVLLAASSARQVGHPDADRLLADVATILHEKFWEESHGAVAEQFGRDWRPYDGYRGQNANMHLCEALMAAFEATAEGAHLRMAERIAELIIGRHAAEAGWLVVEHFTQDWRPDHDYKSANQMFRPEGATPGHSLEWARLLLQLWELGGRRHDWMPPAATALFRRAARDGWDKARGGFRYTIDWDGAPLIADRYGWPCSEGIGAAAVLNAIDGAPEFEGWYRRIWDFSATYLIDREHGGWFPQLGDDNRPTYDLFAGKPDLYHALKACLIPLLPTSGSIAKGLIGSGIAL
jgi:mannose/cellobiose epimerase-like protein (N-acyl-D-glucosamine 2-epimerase family)